MLGYVLDAVAGPGLQEQLDIPSPAPGEALIRVLRSGVCSTDLEMILGYKDGFQGVLGHEFVGVVEAGTNYRRHFSLFRSSVSPRIIVSQVALKLTKTRLAAVDPRCVGAGLVESADGPGTRDDAKQWIGQRVVGEINIVHDAQLPLYGISAAAAPKDLVRNHSPTRTCLGIVGKDGTHAEYITLPLVNLLPVPDTVNDSSAVFCEPLAAACRIVEQGLISCADRVVSALASSMSLGRRLIEFELHPLRQSWAMESWDCSSQRYWSFIASQITRLAVLRRHCSSRFNYTQVLGRQSLETRPVLFGRHESKMSLVAEICDTRLAPREGEPLTGDSAGNTDLFGFELAALREPYNPKPRGLYRRVTF
jgi:hypothetical protein